MTIQTLSLNASHLEDAASLVCQRYRHLRQVLPILPARYESNQKILTRLADLLNESEGVAMLDGSHLAGFMIGLTIEELMGRRCAYLTEYAWATREEDAQRILTGMYAALSPGWVADGCASHAVSCLANDLTGREAWFWLGFGLLNVDGVRDLQPMAGASPDIHVQQVRAEDRHILQAFEQDLSEYMSEAPQYFPHDMVDHTRRMAETGFEAWLAYIGEQPSGCLVLAPGELAETLLLRDPATTYLTSAYTVPEARAKGITTTLLNEAFAWARQSGYQRCAVDFETANPPAAHFWMKHFQPVVYSLLRVLDPRIVSSKQDTSLNKIRKK
jgi:GNAT superfamily N-acetyltransferase